MLTSKILGQHTKVTHGFFTRKNGFSTGIYSERNCGYFSQDIKDNVIKNRNKCAEDILISKDNLVSLNQCHSKKVISISQSSPLPKHENADALVTALPGIGLGILTADCAPVLFYAKDIHAVAAAHAGWRGALNGVIENTLESLVNLGSSPKYIFAAIGPCIQQISYEVGPEFKERFIEHDTNNIKYFKPALKDDHYMYDNSLYIYDRLKKNGLTHIEKMPHDTYTHEDMFFSFRRTVHNNEPDYGRQISIIALQE